MMIMFAAMSCQIEVRAQSKMVRIAQPANIEVIDLNRKNIFNQKSFAQLIQEQHAHDLPYIIARVITKNGARKRVRYCDAHDLNKLFGGYPFERGKTPRAQKSIKEGLPMQHIEYYLINDPYESSFLYLCSYSDLMVGPDKDNFRMLFYANQVEDHALHVKAQRQLARSEQCDPNIRAKATIRLGEIYYDGQYGMRQDYKRARSYFEQAANQDANAAVAMRAQQILRKLYYCGYSDAHHYQKARRYLATKRSGFTHTKCAYYVW